MDHQLGVLILEIGLIVLGFLGSAFGWLLLRAVGGVDDKLKDNAKANAQIIEKLDGKPGRDEMGREIKLGVADHIEAWHRKPES